jgi:hypothetical protein
MKKSTTIPERAVRSSPERPRHSFALAFRNGPIENVHAGKPASWGLLLPRPRSAGWVLRPLFAHN